MVEMALLLPILLMLVFGITEFGRIYYYNLAVSNGARAGVRYAAVTPINTAGGQTLTQYNTALKQYVADRVFPGQTDKIAALVNDNTAGGNITITYNPSPRAKGGDIDITVRYPVEIYAPLISRITGNPRTVMAHMNMRAEN